MNSLEPNAQATQLGLLHKRLAALSEENDLLLSQINRLLDDPRSAVLDSDSGPFDVDASDAGMLEVLRRLWTQHQPAQWQIDLRHFVCGRNWHHAEPDGRWAGPATRSSLRLPGLQAGNYAFCLDVVDAMSADILTQTRVYIEGEVMATELLFTGVFPAQLRFRKCLEQPRLAGLDIEIEFPFVVSPTDQGVPDDRMLGIRAQRLRVEREG